jgi:superoxide dismutase, Fe-Mn family
MTYQAKQFDSINGLPGMSERMMKEHYKLYEAYVKKANEILEKLKTTDKSTANATYSDLRALKLGLSFALDAIKAHELYFGHIGGQGGQPQGLMGKLIEQSFGSFENWDTDMRQTGIAARGWVWCAFDWDTKQIFNYLGDAHDAFPIWNATPLVALDVYEHAYMIDYGVNRADYIKAFMGSLNWDYVEQRIQQFGINRTINQ